MRYIHIKFKNGEEEMFLFEEMRLTRGFLKIESKSHGNRAFATADVISYSVQVNKKQ